VVTLEVNYNLADALDSILRRALDLTPLPRLVQALEEVARLGSAEALRERLSERATDAIADYLDDTGWRQKLDDSTFVTRLVHTAQEVTSTYEGLSDQVKSWWDDLLGRVDLASDSAARGVLERLERLDSDTLDLGTLLDPAKRNTVEILEALSGRSLEDLLLGQNDAFRDVLHQVGARAREALDFLDRLDALPGEVVAGLEGFAAKTGIRDVLDFLSQHATSKAQLEAAIATHARQTLRGLVGRLTGKLFADVTDGEVERVRRWAQHLLDSYQDLQGQVDAAIEKTRGRFGFSLSLAVDRATRRQAWIDVEFDPEQDRVRNIVRRSLERGSPRVLLEELAMADPDDGSAPAFQIREAVFSSRRSRAASVLLSSLGLQLLGTRGERIDEYHVRLEQATAGAPIKREARFSGGYLRTQISGSAEVHCAAWIDAFSRARVQAPGDPFQGIQHGLRLTLGWNDPATTAAQVTALGVILADLGFPPLPAAAEGAVAQGSNGVPTRFALELRLPAAAVPALLTIPAGSEGEADWNRDYLRAGRRWYAETLNPDLLNPPTGPSIGAVLGWVLRQPDFLRRWTEGVNTFTDWAREENAFGRLRRIDVDLIRYPERSNRIAQWFPPYNSLAYFLAHRDRGLEGVLELARGFQAAQASPTQENLARQARLAASALRQVFATAPLDSSSWTNPMFHFWWVLARLARVAPRELATVRGLYSLRWKGSSDTDAWQDPVMGHLEKGVNPRILEDAFRA
jgi:hypothetical protein